MKILKTMVPSKTGLFSCDTIEHEGHLWLVPEWIDGSPSKGFSKPALIIQITYLATKTDSLPNVDYMLQNPLPKGIWNGEISPESEKMYVVIKNPDIVVESPIYH